MLYGLESADLDDGRRQHTAIDLLQEFIGLAVIDN